MKHFPNRSCRVLFIFQLCLFLVRVNLSRGGGSDLLTPIPRWQESWTASQAQGTAMAMAVDDCLVLFLRSPSTDVYKPAYSTTNSNEESTELNGLHVERIENEHNPDASSTQYAPSWFPIGSRSLCAMTGLAMDVEHICRVLQKKVNDHHFVYQTSLTTHAMTQQVASMLQNECLMKGSRPFGVQCLIVGCDDIDPSNGALCIYTIDPTGSWQSWGRATAIGKFGTDVRRNLAKKLRSSSSTSITTVEEATECLIGSWKETCIDLGMNTNNDEEDCEVLILRRDPKNNLKRCLFRVSTEEVDRIMNKIENDVSGISENSL
mmetsp:Transcript_29998/g.64250  ORF Transcript_29998/g.64250 Transcript_29998/m.64250 type:complete len:320 (-) Transcript_29998:299-1258(-)